MTLASLPLPPFLAGIFGLSTGEINGVLLPIAGIILAGVISVSGMYFHNRRREMWHETARLALEKGQPLPPLDPMLRAEDDEVEKERKLPSANHDVRGGLVLIAVGAGLWLFLGGLSRNLGYIGAIPGFIGVALLLFALFSALFRRKHSESAKDTTTRS